MRPHPDGSIELEQNNSLIGEDGQVYQKVNCMGRSGSVSGSCDSGLSIIAISTSVAARERFRTICDDYGIPLSNAIHPTASLSSSVTMGSGNVVCAFCHFGNNTMVGDNNFISAYNSYDHLNCVGNNISTGPGCMVSGSVTIDDNVRMGAGIFIEPLVHIGRNVGIASGSIITASIEPDHVVKRKASGIIVPKNEE